MYRNIILLLLLINFSIKSSCQKDSILVQNCFKYSIISGKNTGQRSILSQKTFDKEGRLVREMFYHDSIVQIKSIVFFFYNNNKLISREEFNNDNSVKKINRFFYNDSFAFLTEEFVYEQINGQFGKKLRITYSYNDSLLVKKIIYDENNKWIENTSFTRDSSRLIEKTQFKKKKGEYIPKEKTITSEYSDQRIIKSESLIKFFGGKKEISSVQYTYNTEPVILETQMIRDNENKVSEITEIRYNNTGTILTKAIKNKEGILQEFYAYEEHKYLRVPINMEMYKIQN